MADNLRNASASSVGLVDEIGRGTSTFDGLSLAAACARHLAGKVRAFTLFSTHYFELTQLAEELEGASNVHLDAVEHDDRIVFMYSVIPGPASQSYGIQVARLAGVPREVIDDARARLAELEWSEARREHAAAPDQLSLFTEAPGVDPALELLETIDPEEVTARQALELLFELKRASGGRPGGKG